jgi:hypothetical protein
MLTTPATRYFGKDHRLSGENIIGSLLCRFGPEHQHSSIEV